MPRILVREPSLNVDPVCIKVVDTFRFGAVQTTMIGIGLWRGERLRRQQTARLALGSAAVLAGLALVMTRR